MKDLTKYIDDDASSESSFKKGQISTAADYMPVVSSVEKELEDDFQEVRKRITSANALAEESVKQAIELAKSSDHPGAWRVVGELLSTLTAINGSLVKVHRERIKSKKEAEVDSGPKTQTNTQNNNYFVGSPSELADMLRKGNETKK